MNIAQPGLHRRPLRRTQPAGQPGRGRGTQSPHRDQLLTGNEDPRRDAAALLNRALAALPTAARAGQIRLRADAGYFAGQLARAALFADIEFAIGARRIAPLWRLLDGLTEADWTDALDMPAAQVAVADYCPNWWPARPGC